MRYIPENGRLSGLARTEGYALSDPHEQGTSEGSKAQDGPTGHPESMDALQGDSDV